MNNKTKQDTKISSNGTKQNKHNIEY